jgi:hypothetical protein
MNIIDRPADEEAPLTFIVIAITPTLASPPRRHSFNNNDDDDNSLPSELSSLMLTPINYNPDMHCHESNPSGSSSVSISYKKAFRLAAFFAILSIAALACVDVSYFVGAPSEPETNVSALQTERSTEVSAKELKSDKKKKKKKKKKVDNKEDAADEDDEESEVVET